MIGILGGSGAVGRSAAAVLASAGAGPIRIGGRNGDATAAVARVVGGEARAVDVTDPSALAGFVSGCRVVVNCAGPSRRLGAVVAAAAAEAGADLVDAGGGGATSASGSRRVALTHAGALPGLSGLLPRWLAAREFDAVRELTLYVAVRDRFTSVGAEDYLDGVLSPETVPGGCWCSGRVVPDPVGRTRVTLPHMDDAWASPYVDDEARSVAAALALSVGGGTRCPGRRDWPVRWHAPVAWTAWPPWRSCVSPRHWTPRVGSRPCWSCSPPAGRWPGETSTGQPSSARVGSRS